MRVSNLRAAVVALVTTGLLGVAAVASASSIPTSQAALTQFSAAASAPVRAPLELTDDSLSLAGAYTSAVALDLAANVGINSLQPQLALPRVESSDVAANSATPTFLADVALPLTLSDVPEPTTFGLFLLGLAGLFMARRVTRKA